MENTSKNINDIFGLDSYGESLKSITESGIKGISKFLDITCRPALEELGLWAKDYVKIWRFKNLYNVLERARGKVAYQDGQIMMVNPRVGISVIDNASLAEEEEVQEMWAGLFASSISPDGKDDSNLLFVNLLKQLTSTQARILRYAFEHSKKVLYDSGLVIGCNFNITLNEAFDLFQIDDINRLDRELDSLRSLGLIQHGLNLNFDDEKPKVNLSLTSLGIYLVSKCQGESSLNTNGFLTEEEYKKSPEYHVLVL